MVAKLLTSVLYSSFRGAAKQRTRNPDNQHSDCTLIPDRRSARSGMIGSLDRGDAGHALNQLAKMVAAHLEIAELVERSTGRRQQHYGFLQVGGAGVAGSSFDGTIDGLGLLVSNLALKS